MSKLIKIRSEKILELINFMSVGEKDINRAGYYTFKFKDRHNNHLIQEYKLNPCQRIVTYSQITAKTGYDKFKVRRSLIALEKEGKIKLKKIYKVVKGWVTKEIIGHIVTLVPVTITIKHLSLEKRKIKGRNISQKTVTPRDCFQTDKSAKNATLNSIFNNKELNCDFNFSTCGINIKSEDLEILKDEEYQKIIEFKNFENEAKKAIKKIKTLKKQKKSELKREIKLTIIVKKQEKINQKNIRMNLDETSKNQKATSFDFNPQGKEIRLNDKIEEKGVKVDQDNLIPNKYKNQFLGLELENQESVLQLYKDLNVEVQITDTLEKKKLIASIMIKYWTNQLNLGTVQNYIVEIRRIRGSHYKANRVIFDYWGLFNSKIGAIGNKNQNYVGQGDYWGV